ncbi:MAG: PKD domain-containing protein [Thermoplasmata archaeon]
MDRGAKIATGVALALAGAALAYVAVASAKPPPPAGTYTVPFQVQLEDATTGVGIPGATLDISIDGTSYSTIVTSGASGTATGSITKASLKAGTSYTLRGTFAGGTISGASYQPTSSTTTFSPTAGTASPAFLRIGPLVPVRSAGRAMRVISAGCVNTGPMAVAWSPQTPTAGQAATFTLNLPNTVHVTGTVDFGDGTGTDFSGYAPFTLSHAYASAGTYYATAAAQSTATNSSGQSIDCYASARETLTVEAPVTEVPTDVLLIYTGGAAIGAAAFSPCGCGARA